MSNAYSDLRAYFGFKPQTAFDTAITGDVTVFPLWLDGSTLDPDAKFEEVMEGNGGRDFSLVFKTKQAYNGKLVCYPRITDIGHFLGFIMGNATRTTTGAADPYTHTYAFSTTAGMTPFFFTAEWGQLDPLAANALIIRTQDCLVKSFELEGEANKPLKLTMDYIGRKGELQSARPTVTNEVTEPLKFTNGTFMIDGGSVAADIAKFKVAMVHDVDEDIMTSTIYPANFVWGKRKITVEFELIFQDNTRFRKVFYGGAAGTADSVTNGTGTVDLTFFQGGDSSLVGRNLEIKMDKIVYQGKPVSPKLDGKAFRQEHMALAVTPSSGDILKLILKNGSAGTVYNP